MAGELTNSLVSKDKDIESLDPPGGSARGLTVASTRDMIHSESVVERWLRVEITTKREIGEFLTGR